MSIKLRRKEKPIKDNEILAFENRFNICLPSDYRDFISKNNGAEPESNEFDVNGFSGGSGVNVFLSLAEIENEKARFAGRLLSTAWPIAFAEGGNYVCLVIGEKAGIYFWDHELEAEEGSPASWNNMFLLAYSFNSFFSLLRKLDVSKIELKSGQVEKVWVNPNFKPKF